MAYDNLRLEKGLYTTSKGFTNALEEIDPSENYIGTPLEGLDAYQRQLKRFGIKVSGINSDTVSKFFETSDSSALFPEYISRAVKQGLSDSSLIDDIVACTTKIDSLDYRAIESVNTNDEVNDSGIVNEGTFIPETVIKTKDTLTTLHKRGKMLVASYEAIKSQKLDVFTVALKQIGEYIARCQMFDLISLLNDNETASIAPTASGTITYKDIVNLWCEMSPYEMTTLVASPIAFSTLLNIDEFKDAVAGLNFHATGKMITPLGAQLVKAPAIFDGNLLIGLDKRYAVEKVQFGDIATDFDKLIDRQLERATVTSTVGFSKIFNDAICKVQG
jgi:HK97 family phage major capsid protein